MIMLPGKTVQHCIPWTELVGIEKISGGFKILTRTERHAFLFFFNLEETLHLVQVVVLFIILFKVNIFTRLYNCSLFIPLNILLSV